MHLFLIVIWMSLAAVLRFTNLESKALWADEFSTLIFSLGNSYTSVPLDQVLSWSALLQPLQVNPTASVGTVIHNLLTESNHPPLYFALSHLWLNLFPAESGLVSLGAARALSAAIGVLTVPAMFGLGWLLFQSKRVGHLAAVLMALSPFGIYLAQEARHYTLAVGWIIGSLMGLAIALRRLAQGQRISWKLCIAWILVNGLGFATHYFVVFALFTEGVVVVGLGLLAEWCRRHQAKAPEPFKELAQLAIAVRANGWRLASVALGTAATVLVWLPVLQTIHRADLTRWLQSGEFDNSSWVDQILRSLAGLITMLYLLPIQAVPTWVVVLSGITVAGGLLVTVPWFIRGVEQLWRSPLAQLPTLLLSGIVIAAIGFYWLLTFGGGVNVASVFRYQFFYFPAVLVLVGAALAAVETIPMPVVPRCPAKIPGPWAIAIVVLLTGLGGLTVSGDWGYQKPHRPDLVAQHIAADFRGPTLVAIPHRNHGQTGRLMGVAWELRRLNPAIATQTQFLLAHYDGDDRSTAIAPLRQALAELPRPLDVWRINFRSEANAPSQAALAEAGCVPISKLLSDDGYRYQHYHCENTGTGTARPTAQP